MESIQTLAKQAKARMKNGYWDEFVKSKREEMQRAEEAGQNVGKVTEEYRRKAKAELFTEKEVFMRAEQEYEQVCRALSCGKVVNPINVLIGAEYYTLTTEEAKQRYLLKLADKFARYKRRYLRERVASVNG